MIDNDRKTKNSEDRDRDRVIEDIITDDGDDKNVCSSTII